MRRQREKEKAPVDSFFFFFLLENVNKTEDLVPITVVF